MSGGPRPRIRRAPRRVAALLIALAVPLVACAAEPESSGGSTSVDPGTATSMPAGPAPTDDLLARLIRLEDVRPLAAFGLDIREQPVLDPQQFALATLRGPCGATIATPFAEAGVFRVFRSTISLVIEAVAQPGAEAANAFVEQLRADAQPGCAPFEEQLGSAEPSTITLQAMIDVSALGEGWIGWTQEVTASSGRVGVRSILVAAEGDRLWLIAVLSPDPISADQLVGLGEVASNRAASG